MDIVPLLPLLSQALEPVPESSNDHRAWASPHSLAPTDPHIETKVRSCQKSPFARRASPLPLFINKIYRSEGLEDDRIAAAHPPGTIYDEPSAASRGASHPGQPLSHGRSYLGVDPVNTRGAQRHGVSRETDGHVRDAMMGTESR